MIGNTLNAAPQGNSIRQSRQNGPSEETAVLFLANLHDIICHFIPCCNISQLRIDTQIRGNDDSRLRGALKHNLRDVRGFADAAIIDRGGDNIEQDLCQDLTMRIADREGNLEQLRRYEIRALGTFHKGRFDIALRQYRDAERYLSFIFSQDHGIFSSSLEQKRRLFDAEIDMKLQFVTCFLYLLPQSSIVWMEEDLFMIFNESNGYPEEQAIIKKHRAHAYLVYGLIALKRGKRSVALHSFFRALCEKPGYDAADKEIDELDKPERRMSMTPPQWRGLRTNLKRMQEVRHRRLGEPPVHLDRVREIEKGWMGHDRPLVYHEGIDREKVCLNTVLHMFVIR